MLDQAKGTHDVGAAANEATIGAANQGGPAHAGSHLHASDID
jgi:hypothetical protein